MTGRPPFGSLNQEKNKKQNQFKLKRMTNNSEIPNEGSTTVEFTVAHQQTKNYREFINTVGIDEIAFYIKKEDLLEALKPAAGASESSFSGIRIYMALKPLEDGKKRSHVYVVATDQDRNDIVKDSENNSLIYDMTWPCPNLCSSSNILNSNTIDL
jgi:hypothetical protein